MYNITEPPNTSRYNAVAVANRRIPQPVAANVSTSTNPTAVPTVLGSLHTLDNRDWRMRK